MGLAVLVFSGTSWAEKRSFEPKIPTSTQLDKVGLECSNIKTHLRKLRSTDALKRVNLGQNYENISNNLMEKLNLAAVSNKMNAAELVAISAEFSENFNFFKENYQIYERELMKTIDTDCSKNYSDFYKELERLRYLREELNFNTKKLGEISKKYLEAVDKFKSGVKQ